MAAFATHHDVIADMGSLTDAQIVTAITKLAFASAIIRSKKALAVDRRIAAGTLDPELVKGVAVAMVVRHLRNPNGYRQEAIEDYSRTRDSSLSAGEVYLSDAELELLSPQRAAAFSVAPAQERATLDDRRRVAWHRQGWGRDGRC